MRNALVVLSILLCSITSAVAQVSVGIGLPGVSIGINLPVYPQLVRVPGYPVYYAPQVHSNYFFYDGMYWVYDQDNWYASGWYNGPWQLVTPDAVPLFVLRVPVRYYRRAPVYFRGWRSDAPPRWGEYWGNAWDQSHRGWDNWNRRSVPAPAPLPVYQRQYSGNRYPHAEQQPVLQSRNYRYQPRDAVVRQHYQGQRVQSAPASSPQVRQGVAPSTTSSQQKNARGPSRSSSPQPGPARVQAGQSPQSGDGDVRRQAASPAPREQPMQQGGGNVQRSARAPDARGQPPAAQRAQQAAGSRGQEKVPQGKGRGQEPKQDHEKDKKGE
jgi:hypothetical protein